MARIRGETSVGGPLQAEPLGDLRGVLLIVEFIDGPPRIGRYRFRGQVGRAAQVRRPCGSVRDRPRRGRSPHLGWSSVGRAAAEFCGGSRWLAPAGFFPDIESGQGTAFGCCSDSAAHDAWLGMLRPVRGESAGRNRQSGAVCSPYCGRLEHQWARSSTSTHRPCLSSGSRRRASVAALGRCCAPASPSPT